MANTTITLSRFVGGIADYTKESLVPDAYAWGRSIDVRSDPQNMTLLPRTIKESSTTIQALPKWFVYVNLNSLTYAYDEAGNIYSRTSAGLWTYLHTAAMSHGNGMNYFGEDGSLYYTNDTTIGRYGPLNSASPQFVDDYFGSQGGVPLNTASLTLNGTTQYASRADTATTSITGNISIEAQIKPSSLPVSSGQMTLVSKWTENGNLRSYKFGITTISNYFGNGSDGPLTISSNTTEVPIDSACTGTSGSYSLSATNASFAAGQQILIIQMQGATPGINMKNTIQAYTAGTITLVLPLNADYTSTSQVRVLKQHTTVTVNLGITYTAKAWNGTTGGVLAFLASGALTVTGTISGSGRGFRGAAAVTGASLHGLQGEGTGGASGAALSVANGNGGGGGGLSTDTRAAGGGGGGSGLAGNNGDPGGYPVDPGIGGAAISTADLTTMVMGGGGGSGGTSSVGAGQTSGTGKEGGAIIFISAQSMTVTGSIVSNGVGGGNPTRDGLGAGGGGGAGVILLKTQTGTLGTLLVTETPGPGGLGTGAGPIYGGDGGIGRVHLDYSTSYTGITSPTLNALLDPTLGSADTYALSLSISSNGTNVETYTKPIPIEVSKWQDAAVSWTASTSTAEFYLNAVSYGTVTGSLTSIVNNASTFNVGVDFDGAGAAQHFYAGKIDEVRLFNVVRTAADYLGGVNTQINPATAGLQAYYHFNSNANDSTANANTLTLTGAPSYSTDVPYASPTTPLNRDQFQDESGDTYAVPTTISESSTDRLTFTPTKDPQISIQFNVSNIGTGTWVVTIHDMQNNTIATSTVTNANMNTGDYVFTYAVPWSPLTNFTNQYHAHITCASGSPTIVSGLNNDLESADYATYYQFLITNGLWHAVAPMLQFLTFLNGRYLGKLEATLYDPNFIVFPSDWTAISYGYWNEYLAIGCIRGDTVTQQDDGRIFFWDGIAPTYNFFVPVPEGGVTALLGARGELNVWAGYQGEQLIYRGGASCEKVKKMPKIESDESMMIYPGAACMWQSLIRYGSAGETTSTDIQQGVYTWGKSNIRYPDILTYDYPISTGTLTGTTLRIGATLAVNQKLLIGWADGTGYGVDYVDSANDCYPTGTVEFLYDDLNDAWREKRINILVARLKTLESGQTVLTKYRIDDQTQWTTGIPSTSANSPLFARQTINTAFYEIQYGLDIASTSGDSPKVYGLGVERDPNEESTKR